MAEESTSRLDSLEDQVEEHERRLSRHSALLDTLSRDMAELRAMLGRVATKDDVLVVLRDALKSVPGKHAAIYTAALVVLTALSIIVPLYFHGH